MPMEAKLVGTDKADEFALTVPPITFSIPGVPLTVSPSLLATVTSEPDRVCISSDACTLSGSPFVESLRLNERFDFRVRTVFTWADGATDGAVGGAEIRSSSEIEVDVETPKLFALVPRRLLEAIATYNVPTLARDYILCTSGSWRPSRRTRTTPHPSPRSRMASAPLPP